MFAWMIYVMAVTVFLSGGALAAERRARLKHLPSRWLWGLAIIASLLLPTIVSSVSIQLPTLAASAVPQKIIALREVTSASLSPQTWMTAGAVKAATSRSMDVLLQRSWLCVSAIMLAVLLANGAHLFRRKRQWAEGIEARDPQLLTIALFLLVLMPWNLPLWWQLRRPRSAVWHSRWWPSRRRSVLPMRRSIR